MANSKTPPKAAGKKGMTSEEYLDYLTREEKRSSILSFLEKDPEEQKKHERKNKMLKRLIRRVKRMAGTDYHAANEDNLDVETPEQNKAEFRALIDAGVKTPEQLKK